MRRRCTLDVVVCCKYVVQHCRKKKKKSRQCIIPCLTPTNTSLHVAKNLGTISMRAARISNPSALSILQFMASYYKSRSPPTLSDVRIGFRSRECVNRQLTLTLVI